MKTKHAFSPRMVAGALLGSLGLAAAPATHAATTDLADLPIAIWTLPPPNIMLTLDNSGSMHWGFMPGSAIDNTRKKCFTSPQYNTLFYNPENRYLPGRRADGSSYPASDFKAAYVNGYNHDAVWGVEGYSYADRAKTTRIPPNSHGEFSYFDHKKDSTAPIDLSKDFHAIFDVMAHHRFDDDFLDYWTVTPVDRAYYHAYTGPQPADNTCHDDAYYRKVYINLNSRQEKQNFANWFTYYRSRLQTAKTVLTQAFAELDGDYRVGLSMINDFPAPKDSKDIAGENLSGAYFLPVDRFVTRPDGKGQKDRWFDTIINLVDEGGTPMIAAADKMGRYFSKQNPYPASGVTYPDPILPAVASCQRNYQLLTTDGYWEDKQSVVGDTDAKVPANLPVPNLYDPVAKKRLQIGKPFPPPYGNQSYDASVVNMADVAMKYWSTNLRPDADIANAVVAGDTDPATWPHLNTFAISLGERGTLDPDNPQHRAGLIDGTRSWPEPVHGTETAIDDLWHAAFNGHGDFIVAKDNEDLSRGLRRMLAKMNSARFSGAAVGVSVPDLELGPSLAFESSYDSGGWIGELKAKKINAASGAIEEPPVWTAQRLLDSMDWNLRNIATSIPKQSGGGNKGVSFSVTTLPDEIRARLDSPASTMLQADHANVIQFLRGDRKNEGKLYRTRVKILGDLIDAEPVYVGPPAAQYADAGYADFKNKQVGRDGMVYQGANDGMLHAFDAANGVERWAYIPGLLLNAPYKVQAGANHGGVNHPNTSSLVNLSMLSGFRHLNYVDGTPAAADIDFGHAGGASVAADWKTILVGGLQKGGRGYYALDITTPLAPKKNPTDPDTAARLALWEFPQNGTSATMARNIGYSYGKPVIVKTASMGWVVLVTSGYNNGSDTGGDGKGHLFVLDPKDGGVIADIVTHSGDDASPSGLAQISAYAERNNINNTTDFVYGGDLKGNLWRFNLAKTPKDWNVKLLARLVDAEGNPQPVTSAPELAKVDGKRLVYVGTGQYLGPTDRPASGGNAHSTQTQSLYGLIDDGTDEPTIASVRGSDMVRQSITTSGANQAATARVTGNKIDLTKKKGWYIDLPHQFERVVQRPTLVAKTVTFTTAIPGADPCVPFGNSWMYTVDYASGGDVSGEGNDFTGHFFGDTLVSRPVPIRVKATKDNQKSRFLAIVRTYGGGAGTDQDADSQTGARDPKSIAGRIGTGQPAPQGQRIFWREVIPK